MGLRGLSVIVATGDNGIGNFKTSTDRCQQAWPDWPATSPYVTAVGGTRLMPNYLPICSQQSVVRVTVTTIHYI